MPAPELTTQTPGEPLATMTPLADTSQNGAGDPPEPVFIAKHNGGGRWKIWCTPAEGDADWFSDFVVVGDGAKEQAEAEAQRLNDGGEPLAIDPQRLNEPTIKASPAASVQAIDATQLKQAVMTPDGWLCPEPPVKE